MPAVGTKKEIHRRPKALTDVLAKLPHATRQVYDLEVRTKSRQDPVHFNDANPGEPSEPRVAGELSLPAPTDDDLPIK